MEKLTLQQDTNANSRKKRAREDGENVDPRTIEIADGTPIDMSCQQVRAKIRQMLNSGEMKVGEMATALDVGDASMRNFLGQNGSMKGVDSDTYQAGWEFFKKREMSGVKMPTKKKAKTNNNRESNSGNKSGTADKDDKDKLDVSDIHLDGEKEGNVPIYDTCQDVRIKINAHLRNSTMTQTAFLRELGKQIPGEPTPSGQRLKTFIGGKAPLDGGDSPVFYGAYVWFEKLRIKQNKKKSKKREEMEKIWVKNGGVPRINQKTAHFYSKTGPPSIDKYGQLHHRR